jgi:hypothetical protein
MRILLTIICLLSITACSSQVTVTIDPTPVPTEVVVETPTATSTPALPLGPREPASYFGLVFGQQYALREANNTFRYVKLISQRSVDAERWVAYDLGICPEPSNGTPLVLSFSNYGRLTSIEGALAEELRPRNQACADQDALPFLGPSNGFPLQVSTGKQYAIIGADRTFQYYRLERREIRGEPHYYFSECPNPISPDRLLIKGDAILERLMTINHALNQGYTPSNDPCNSSVLHGN